MLAPAAADAELLAQSHLRPQTLRDLPLDAQAALAERQQPRNRVRDCQRLHLVELVALLIAGFGKFFSEIAQGVIDNILNTLTQIIHFHRNAG